MTSRWPDGTGAHAARCTYAVTVLSGLRDDRGRPNARVRVLAVLLALLLAGPLTLLVARVLSSVLGALY